MIPDIGWCTAMKAGDMPWHTDVNMKASNAAGLLNAIPMALEWMHEQGLEQNVEVPDDLPTIRHRVSYCAFASDIVAASACIDDEEECPTFYHLGGVSDTVPAYEDSASDAYFQKLWTEFDYASTVLENEGVTAKPVAMISSIYSGDLVDGMQEVIGYAGSTGGLDWETPAQLGSIIVEAEQFAFPVVAHELGHALGLSHTVNNGTPVNMGGFMQAVSPFPVVSLLGPSANMTDGYGAASQWPNWAVRFGDKTVPRANAFAWTGCDDDSDCPSQLECWFFTANIPGVCRWPL